MNARRRPLEGRVVLVLGAGDPVGEAAALHASALGASIVVAGPRLGPVVATAGLVAATRGTVRVVEAPSPPLLDAALLAVAAAALAPVTDALVAAGAMPDLDAARRAADDLRRALPDGARVELLDARPADGPRRAAERAVGAWVSAARG